MTNQTLAMLTVWCGVLLLIEDVSHLKEVKHDLHSEATFLLQHTGKLGLAGLERNDGASWCRSTPRGGKIISMTTVNACRLG